jgi:hypothetical protein
MTQLFAENKHIIYKKDIPVGGNSLGIPESEVEIGACLASDFPCDLPQGGR